MATLPASVIAPTDPTLDAIGAAMENVNRTDPPRGYLGMSSIGEECERRLFYQFRFCFPAGGGFDAKGLSNVQDGHRTEDVMAERLRMVPGVELHTVDPTSGKQFGFKDLAGHFRGHIDGAIRGILQAPKAWHIWENKASEKGPAELAKAKADVGEKAALAKWHPTYYAQAVLYMHYGEMDRHYITVTGPGGRMPWTSARTNAAPEVAATLIAKADRVIFAAEPPPRLSDDPSFFKCKFCPAAQTCHTARLPAPSCRTCLHATPERDGDGRWSCALADAGVSIPLDVQRSGCESHLYIPALLKRWGEVEDASEAEGWVSYKAADGHEFRNGPWGIGSYTSKELHGWMPGLLREPEFQALRVRYAAHGTAETFEEAVAV